MEKITVQAKYEFSYIKRQEVWEALMSLGRVGCRSSVMYKMQNSGSTESKKGMFKIKRKNKEEERKVRFLFRTKK